MDPYGQNITNICHEWRKSNGELKKQQIGEAIYGAK
jgi:hypothetical protein